MDDHPTGTRLVLLGAPHALRDGAPVRFDRKRSLALLAYLCVNKGPHHREQIAALLWPDSDESHARGSLRAVLSDLRRNVGRESFRESGELVGPVDESSVRLDVDTLTAAVESVRSRASSDPLETLASAVALHHGSFMSGFTVTGCTQYADWQIFCDGYYRGLVSWALEKLIELCIESGAYEKGIEFARRWTALDSLHEPAHRSLMRLYALSGQSGAALRQYEQCAWILQAEFGFEPEPETMDLAKAIRKHAVVPTRARAERQADGPGPAIAVLPLVWMGAAGSDAWFADGIADALSGSLSRISGVSVTPFSASCRYRGSVKTDQWVAAELGVDLLLAGSVLRSDGELAVSLRLVLVSSGEQIWSERYRRHGENLLDFQDEIAREVTRVIRPLLGTERPAGTGEVPQIDPEAYELFLRAKYVFRVALHIDSMLQALDLLHEAVSIDPGFADAHAELSLVYGYIAGGFPGYLGLPPNEANRRAKEAAERALELDPNQETARCTIAAVLFEVDWEFERAVAMYREILGRNPRHQYARISLGQTLLALGCVDEAIELFARARSVDPIDSTLASSIYLTLRIKGLYRQAMLAADRMDELHPNTFRPYLWRAEVHYLTGNYTRSVEEYERAFAVPHGEPFAIHFAPFYLGSLVRSGNRDAALDQLELVRTNAEAGTTPLNHLAMAYCGLSDMENCRLWLRRSLEERERSFLTLRFEVYWDALVSDPVCSQIIQEAGIDDRKTYRRG